MPNASFRWVPPVLMLVLTAFQLAQAQLSSLKQAVEGPKPKEEAAPEKSNDVRKRLEQWHQKAREDLDRLENAGTKAALPEGITQSEVDDRRRDLEQMAIITTGSLKNLEMIPEARKAAEAARGADVEWTGFKEAPPYSILMLDELLNERDAVKSKLASHEASLANFERLLANVLTEAKAAEDTVSKQIVAVQSADAATESAAKWRLESARIKSRLMAARASYLQASGETYKERVAASKAELALVERKILAVKPGTRFAEEDLAKIDKLAKERKSSVEKELAAVSKRLKSAFALRSKAQDALAALPAAADGGESSGLELAKLRVDVAEARIEALQVLSEQIEGLIQLENIGVKAYRERYTIMTSTVPKERESSLEAIGMLSERLRAWLTVVDNELASCWADLSAIESRAASITVDDPRFPLINEQRAVQSEKLAMIQRVRQLVSTQRKLVRRWIDDHTPKSGDEGLFVKVSSLGDKTWETAKKIWSFEVMSFEDKVEVDGQTITGKYPITLGMLLRALLFFYIGYRIVSYVAKRIQRSVVLRGHIAEAQANTLRNWGMIVVGFFLILGTLKFLHIPLTAFAFFGGALAIGIGFGTQTLIKNFISGIIVLAERKVRVGDVLDVDGIVGTVVEVNTRSSIIRSADDVETMIPNSLFLENRVTNWTLSSSKIRRSLRVGVAYGTDPRTVMDILTECAGRHGRICKDPAPFATFEEFGDNALLFSLYFWVELGPHTSPMIVTSDLRLMIEKRFSEAGIGVPFPQREMHLTTDKPIQVQMTHDR
jgi:small-conductance mechanosensitive channel